MSSDSKQMPERVYGWRCEGILFLDDKRNGEVTTYIRDDLAPAIDVDALHYQLSKGLLGFVHLPDTRPLIEKVLEKWDSEIRRILTEAKGGAK